MDNGDALEYLKKITVSQKYVDYAEEDAFT